MDPSGDAKNTGRLIEDTFERGISLQFAQKLKELELKIETHDEHITAIFDAINRLIAPPPVTKRKIGFQVKEKKVLYKKA